MLMVVVAVVGVAVMHMVRSDHAHPSIAFVQADSCGCLNGVGSNVDESVRPAAI